MKIYGDIENLSKTKKNKIERYYKMFKDLNMELSVIITLDGWIYKVEYNGNTHYIEDDIIDSILGSISMTSYKIIELDIYMKVLSNRYNLNSLYDLIEKKKYHYMPTEKLFNIKDNKISCKSYKEFIEYHNKYRKNKRMKTYKTDESILNKKNNYDKSLCVYRFLDEDDNVLYVGKTQSMTYRIMQHFTGNGHLKSECYRQVKKIQYMQCKNDSDMKDKEIYFINKYKPKYNKVYIYEGNVHNTNYDLIQWHEYPMQTKNQQKDAENN